jgi:hypothetical protein
MSLTDPQLATLKTAINADPQFADEIALQDWPAIANTLNEVLSPAFVVWRSNVTRNDIYTKQSPEGTLWDWTIYMTQTVPQQGAWVEMFNSGQLNMALPNIRTGVEKIYGLSNASTTHVKAVGKRSSTYGEKVFATGAGTLATPATMAVEGAISATDVQKAMTQ